MFTVCFLIVSIFACLQFTVLSGSVSYGAMVSVPFRFRDVEPVDATSRNHTLQGQAHSSPHHRQRGQKIHDSYSPHHRQGQRTQDSIMFDKEMVGTIYIGGKPFEVMFDSGSKDLWVFGKDVNRDYFTHDKFQHSYYDFRDFDTYESCHEDLCLKVVYADDCKVSGQLAYETVGVGSLVVHDVPFGIIDKLEGPKDQFTQYDGMFGLGYDDSSLSSPFAKMIRSHQLQHNMFSVFLHKNEHLGGIITFGGAITDEAMIKYPIELVPVLQPVLGWRGEEAFIWAIPVTSMHIMGKKKDAHITPPRGTHFVTLVDTGCSYVEIPQVVFEIYFMSDKRISDAMTKFGGYVFCSERSKLPTIHVGAGSRMYPLHGEDYTSPPMGIRQGGRSMCFLNLSGYKTSSDVKKKVDIVLGQPFLRKYYAMFHYDYEGFDGPVIGFAETLDLGSPSSDTDEDSVPSCFGSLCGDASSDEDESIGSEGSADFLYYDSRSSSSSDIM